MSCSLSTRLCHSHDPLCWFPLMLYNSSGIASLYQLMWVYWFECALAIFYCFSTGAIGVDRKFLPTPRPEGGRPGKVHRQLFVGSSYSFEQIRTRSDAPDQRESNGCMTAIFDRFSRGNCANATLRAYHHNDAHDA